MANLNQTMPREPPAFIDKLLMTCLVNVERIEPFHCEICDKLYCRKESLTDHLTTHIKKEIATDFDETMTYRESGCSEYNLDSNTASVGHTLRTIKSEDNSVTQGPFLSIRDRIKFETEDTIDAAIRATCGNVKQITCTAVNNISSKFTDTSSTSNSKPVPFGHVNLKMSYGSLIPCKTCNEKFAHRSSLKWHEATCHKKSQMSVEKPKQIHLVDIKQQPETKHLCDVCWNVFPSNHQLSLHSKFHYPDKSWDCNMCAKTFQFAYQLKRHQRMHTDERPYSCAICNVHFRNCSSLSYHNGRKHNPKDQQPTSSSSSSRSYECHLCNVTFTKKFYKDRHVKLTHKKILNYECDMCKKKFGRKDHLLRHITNKCCLEPYKCRKCKRSFSKSMNFRKHKTKCKKK